MNRADTAGVEVIVGAGPVGTALATLLAAGGARVRVVTRSGRGPELPGVERVSLDASDIEALSEQTGDAAVIYNCANPGTYMEWREAWPPLAASILEAAKRSGAVLVTMSNLYGYGPVQGPITRDAPLRPSDYKGDLRVQMWEGALAAHEAGDVRVTEARASDYIGPSVGASGILHMYASATLAGRTANVFASPDVPHTWTYVGDVARTLAVLAHDERAWGSAWIVPSNEPRTVREVLRELSAVHGLSAPAIRHVPRWLVRAGGALVPILRELNGVLYQFDEPFVAGGEETTAELGIEPMPWREIVEATALAWAEGARRP